MLIFSIYKFKQWCDENGEDFENCKRWVRECSGKEATYDATLDSYRIGDWLIAESWCDKL